jgi:hypothetical protein
LAEESRYRCSEKLERIPEHHLLQPTKILLTQQIVREDQRRS